MKNTFCRSWNAVNASRLLGGGRLPAHDTIIILQKNQPNKADGGGGEVTNGACGSRITGDTTDRGGGGGTTTAGGGRIQTTKTRGLHLIKVSMALFDTNDRIHTTMLREEVLRKEVKPAEGVGVVAAAPYIFFFKKG